MLKKVDFQFLTVAIRDKSILYPLVSSLQCRCLTGDSWWHVIWITLLCMMLLIKWYRLNLIKIGPFHSYSFLLVPVRHPAKFIVVFLWSCLSFRQVFIYSFSFYPVRRPANFFPHSPLWNFLKYCKNNAGYWFFIAINWISLLASGLLKHKEFCSLNTISKISSASTPASSFLNNLGEVACVIQIINTLKLCQKINRLRVQARLTCFKYCQ